MREREDDRSRERAEGKFLAGTERLLEGGNKGYKSRLSVESEREYTVEKLGESAGAERGEGTETEKEFRDQKEDGQRKETGRSAGKDIIQLI